MEQGVRYEKDCLSKKERARQDGEMPANQMKHPLGWYFFEKKIKKYANFWSG